MAGEDVAMHAKFRRYIATLTPAKASSVGATRIDIFQVVALMEMIFPVKFVMLWTETDLMEISISDPFTFSSCYSD